MKKIIIILTIMLIALPVWAQKDDTMNRTKRCKQTFSELFDREALTGQGSDPELMNILQKFIFGEVFYTGNIDNKTREMITCVCLATMQTLPQLEAHANAALNIGITPLELREAIYQCAPVIGFPRTLNAVASINKVFSAQGIPLPLESQNTVTETDRHKKGKEIQMPLYGNEIEETMQSLPDGMGQDVSDFLTEMCFGDFYTRGVLDVKTRELLMICVLATLGTEKQIRAHTLGNLHAGNSKEILYAAMIQCLPYIGFPNAMNAINIIKNTKEEGKDLATISVFPVGKENTAFAQYFSGKSWLAPLTSDKELNVPMFNVTFEPGCRNNWHSHTGGQILVAVGGRGFYQEKDKSARELYPGDIVEIAPNVIHWHGAAPDSWFSHLAIECNPRTNKNTWYEKVSDKEYEKATK